MAKVSKAMQQVFGASMEISSRYDVGEKVDGAYPAQIRKGKTEKDKAKGHVPYTKNRRVAQVTGSGANRSVKYVKA